MARRVQQIIHLRCSNCDGYGFVPVQSWSERGHQAGEETCPQCGGDGSKRKSLLPVMVRKLPKQRKLSLSDLDEEIRKYVGQSGLNMILSFNNIEAGDYYGYVWLSDDDMEKAISQATIWTMEICGRHLDKSLYLAASSLPILVQMLGQYEFQSAPQH